MSSKVLLDTNVMLDLALARPEGFDAAAAIAEADSLLAPLPTARGEGSGERSPGLDDRGGEQ